MALIKCSECGKNISNMASECPHCGAAVKKEVSSPKKNNNLVINIFVFILLGIITVGVLVLLGDFFDLLDHPWNHERLFYTSCYYLASVLFLVAMWLGVIYSLIKKSGLKLTAYIILGIACALGLIYMISYLATFVEGIEEFDDLEMIFKFLINYFTIYVATPSLVVLLSLRK